MSTLKKNIVACVVIAGLSACHQAEESKHPVIDEPLVVKATEALSLQPVKPVVLPGELHSWNKVNLYSKVKGFVKEINVDRGTFVKKGQILLVLDAPEILAELDQAEGQFYSAEASLTEARERFSASRLTYMRLLKASHTPGAIALNELDQVKAKMRSDSVVVLSAEGSLMAAKSHFHTKKAMAEYLRIVAPFNGIIIERNVSPGALVGVGDVNSKPLLVLEDNEKLRLTIAVPEIYSNALHKSSEVSFSVNSAPDKEFKAWFGRSAESVLEKSRVMMTEFDVNNKAGELKAGMYVEARLPFRRISSTIFVPKTSVVTSSEKVFVIRSVQNKAEWVPVKKGISLDTLIEIFGAVSPGELIIKDASEEIREATPIQLKK